MTTSTTLRPHYDPTTTALRPRYDFAATPRARFDFASTPLRPRFDPASTSLRHPGGSASTSLRPRFDLASAPAADGIPAVAGSRPVRAGGNGYGDGRALSLCEVTSESGARWELQLKGAV